MEQGQIHVYTGDGKGKTTAAIGLAIRALGAGKTVYMGQFIKDMEYHELVILKQLPNITVELYGSGDGCFLDRNPGEQDLATAKSALDRARKALTLNYDLVILDEINLMPGLGLLKTEDLLELMASKKETTELVFTGRYCPQEVIDHADLVTEMKELRHYYREKGLLARDGIER